MRLSSKGLLAIALSLIFLGLPNSGPALAKTQLKFRRAIIYSGLGPFQNFTLSQNRRLVFLITADKDIEPEGASVQPFAQGPSRLRIYDVSNPASPKPRGELALGPHFVSGLAERQGKLIIAASALPRGSLSPTTIFVVDVLKPELPTVAATFQIQSLGVLRVSRDGSCLSLGLDKYLLASGDHLEQADCTITANDNDISAEQIGGKALVVTDRWRGRLLASGGSDIELWGPNRVRSVQRLLRISTNRGFDDPQFSATSNWIIVEAWLNRQSIDGRSQWRLESLRLKIPAHRRRRVHQVRSTH
jgi:hypothetical protein